MNPWISAARSKTLSAGAVPVLVGSALAYMDKSFSLDIFFATLLGALSLQIATNYINDASDFLRGADSETRIGPPRMAQLGLLTPRSLYLGACFCFLIALLAGIFLILHAGIIILWIGIFSIIGATAYTAGPFPLAYYGLGELFVFIFFGLTAVCGTYFSHTHGFSSSALLAAIMVGLLAMAIILVNNTRDITTDTMAGKKTMSVRFGKKLSQHFYATIVLLPFLLLYFFIESGSWKFIFPITLLPLAAKNIHDMYTKHTGEDFNALLARTAKLELLFGFLFSLAAIL